ncbi:uncharacterized protein M437DRAFT_64171 [Aureobasidium melanogenum CBS 110374]|uniref:Uncharacterized protein n=1 Tax=Aureobasidium melanogenum (strain CBS 110374) TaxID=1043003 RepID=A0A074VZ16_AURM1|nr:uncharacterized protein M437DRAFT_64171 [Aureobasidium melanogenum CBS 110374]KEQ64519.1 hypothetical protein M437DRAFT_64171 [Aureobasidium melanogenum CBS 110374]
METSRGCEMSFHWLTSRGLDAHIHSDDAGYASIPEESVPLEFRDVAVLSDITMLDSWYSAIFEHSPFRQMMQPLQLFSRLYPEFDHYWQLEMDSRQERRIPSETTLPSFVLWHGLKLFGLPLPIFQDPERNRVELNFVLNGRDMEQFPDGFANGPVNTREAPFGFFVRGKSFDWVSPMPDRTMASWKGEEPPDDNMPKVLVERDGKIYAPAMFMHPRKTNFYRSN